MFQKVRVNGDWNDPAKVWQDVQLATGMQSRNAGTTFGTQLYISLWEGVGDPDDYAVCEVDNINGNENASFEFDFATVPPVGATAFVVGVEFGMTPLD